MDIIISNRTTTVRLEGGRKHRVCIQTNKHAKRAIPQALSERNPPYITRQLTNHIQDKRTTRQQYWQQAKEIGPAIHPLSASLASQ